MAKVMTTPYQTVLTDQMVVSVTDTGISATPAPQPQQAPITDEFGYIKIGAMDHRDSLEKLIGTNQMAIFKKTCAEAFAPFVTAILVDPEYGQETITITKNQHKALLLSREISGYTDSDDGRVLQLYPFFTSKKLKEMGADMVKLLVYYNNLAPNNRQQIDLVAQVKQEAQAAHIPLFLEPITYPYGDEPYHKGDVILHAIRDLKKYADVLKLEYPVDVAQELVENGIPYLEEMTREAEKPWVLLSRGMPFETFYEAVTLARDAGAKGYAVGRAAWQEAVQLPNWEEMAHFIQTTATERMKALSALFSGDPAHETTQNLT